MLACVLANWLPGTKHSKVWKCKMAELQYLHNHLASFEEVFHGCWKKLITKLYFTSWKVQQGGQHTCTHVHKHACIHARMRALTHIHTQPFYGSIRILSGTTRVSWYQKKHSPTHTYRGHQSSLIYFFHLIRSMAPSTHTHIVKYCTTMYKVKNLPLWLFQKLNLVLDQ